jgi:hypothetical protein
MCEARNILLLYLPPYSPDYNPIEQNFHWLKQWLRQHQDECPSINKKDYEPQFKLFLKRACRQFTREAPHKKF